MNQINPIVEWGTTHKTQLVGALAVVTGLITMMTSGGDTTQMNAGWTQLLGGLYAIFMRQGMKKVEDKVDQAKDVAHETKELTLTAVRAGPAPQTFLQAATTGYIEAQMSSADIAHLQEKGEILLMSGMTEVKIKKVL